MRAGSYYDRDVTRGGLSFLPVNDLQLPSDDDIAMGQGLPVDGVSIDQGAEPGAGIFEKMATFPRLEAEVNGREAKMSGDGHVVGRVRPNADASFREEEAVALGSSEFSHGFDTDYNVSAIANCAKDSYGQGLRLKKRSQYG